MIDIFAKLSTSLEKMPSLRYDQNRARNQKQAQKKIASKEAPHRDISSKLKARRKSRKLNLAPAVYGYLLLRLSLLLNYSIACTFFATVCLLQLHRRIIRYFKRYLCYSGNKLQLKCHKLRQTEHNELPVDNCYSEDDFTCPPTKINRFSACRVFFYNCAR